MYELQIRNVQTSYVWRTAYREGAVSSLRDRATSQLTDYRILDLDDNDKVVWSFLVSEKAVNATTKRGKL